MDSQECTHCVSDDIQPNGQDDSVSRSQSISVFGQHCTSLIVHYSSKYVEKSGDCPWALKHGLFFTKSDLAVVTTECLYSHQQKPDTWCQVGYIGPFLILKGKYFILLRIDTHLGNLSCLSYPRQQYYSRVQRMSELSL